jgi:hypothetical protein
MIGGLDLSNPPEALEPGKFTRLKNPRFSTELVLEGRQGVESWEPDQKQYYAVGTTNRSGPLLPYPTRWDIGRLRAIRYIGDIKDEFGTVYSGFLTIHSPGTDSNNTCRVFINGCPVLAANADCTEYAAGYSPLTPRGFSIVRATAANGKPIVVLDGSWYIPLQDITLGVGQDVLSSFDYGDDTADVPAYFAYKLGMTKPSAAPSGADGGTGLLDSSVVGASPYQWKYTYYNNSAGFNSPASDASGELSLTLRKATVTVTNPSDPQVTHIRLWRTGGTLATGYRLVSTTAVTICPGGTTNITDNVSDEDLALEELLDEDSVEPFTSIDANGQTITAVKFEHCWGPFIGKYLFWVGDAYRPGYVYWNDQTSVALNDSTYGVNAVSDPGETLLTGFIFGGNSFVWSRLKLYALDYEPGAEPEFTPREIPIGMGLAGRWAQCVGPNAVYFLGRDGIYKTVCQGEEPECITDKALKPLFLGEDAGGLEAVDYSQENELRLALAAKSLHFFYRGDSGTQYHLVYDLEFDRWAQWSNDDYALAYLNEDSPWSQTILGDYNTSDLYLFDDSFDNSEESFAVTMRSGSWDSGIPLTNKEFGVLLLDYDPGGANISITPYYNSELTAGTTLYTNTAYQTGRRVTSWSLDDYYARSIALEFNWTDSETSHPKLYQATLLFREDEEVVTHWEMNPTGYGDGWFHFKDAWIAIRSTGTVRMTVVTDETYTDIYDIPSTSEAKTRHYVEFIPRKGRLVQIKFDGLSASPGAAKATFRLYGEDSVWNVKNWKTGATYQSTNPFTPVGYAQYLRKEGGT